MMRTTVSPARQEAALPMEMPKQSPIVGQQHLGREELQELKKRLLGPILEKTREAELRKRIELAANEALAMAWSRPLPFLILPCLLEEKAREVQRWFRRQRQILTLTGALFEEWEKLRGTVNFQGFSGNRPAFV